MSNFNKALEFRPGQKVAETNNGIIDDDFRLYSLEAEQGIIGVLLQDNKIIEQLDFLKPQYFYESINGWIFNRIYDLVQQGFVGTRDTLLQELYHNPNFVNGQSKEKQQQNLVVHLHNCFRAGSVMTDYVGAALLIEDRYLKRELFKINNESIRELRTKDGTAKSIIEQAEHRIYQLATHGDYRRDCSDFSDLLNDAQVGVINSYKNKKITMGIATGFADLDNLISGLQKSDLLILAARPSMGKTALAINIAVNCCKNEEVVKENGCVVIFSLEMSSAQLTDRIISMETGLNIKDIRHGRISKEGFERVMEYTQIDGKKLKLFIDDTAGLSIANLQARARRQASKHKVKAIFVDYLQLIHSTKVGQNTNRVQEVSEISQGLKNLAKELNIPVVALSQLSRGVESREDKRPVLSDLRDSGSIEQDADVVMFIYREEYYLRRTEPTIGTAQHVEWQKKMDNIMNNADVIVAKQRNGPVGTAKLYFDSGTTKFGNLLITENKNYY